MPTTMVMQEMAAAARHLHADARAVRQARRKGHAPACRPVLPPLPAGAPANRLGLARWLVDPASSAHGARGRESLLADVFRQGLVKTAEDFGSQGEWPSHPELLDWLAAEFVRIAAGT